MAFFARKKRPEKPSEVIEPPVSMVVRFEQVGSAKDVEAIARNHCVTKYAKDISWYTVAKFAGGHMFECHQGGNGVAYLPEIIHELSQNMAAGEVHMPSGSRLFRVSMRESHPVCLLLSEQDSREAAGKPTTVYPRPTGKMKPAVSSGDMFIQVGVTLMLVGTISMFAAIGYYFISASNQQLNKAVAYEQLPHRQWDSIKRLRTDQYVNRLRYADGRWQIDFADNPRVAAGGPPAQQPPGQPARPAQPGQPVPQPQVQPQAVPGAQIQPQVQPQAQPAPQVVRPPVQNQAPPPSAAAPPSTLNRPVPPGPAANAAPPSAPPGAAVPAPQQIRPPQPSQMQLPGAVK